MIQRANRTIGRILRLRHSPTAKPTRSGVAQTIALNEFSMSTAPGALYGWRMVFAFPPRPTNRWDHRSEPHSPNALRSRVLSPVEVRRVMRGRRKRKVGVRGARREN